MPRDYVFSGQLLSAGPNVLGMAIPTDAAPGLTFARFRFSRDSVLDPEGPAPNGEVEDYQVEIVDGGGSDEASVGDWVWEDLNRNGLQEPGEPGLGGVQVDLFDAAGNPVTVSTTTNASGFYQFTNLAPAQYSLRFTAPPGFDFSPMDQGIDDTIDSDVYPSAGDTPLFTLSAGEQNTTMDAGLYESGGPGPSDQDYGDAPAGYPNASHLLGGPYLGSTAPDADPGMRASALCDGDDNDADGDDEGVFRWSDPYINPTTNKMYIDIEVEVTGTAGQTATYVGWFDLDHNGSWNDPGERVIYGACACTGTTQAFQAAVEVSSANYPAMNARLRVYTGRLGTDSIAPDRNAGPGEVEDHRVVPRSYDQDLDFGDAPDTYGTLKVSGGPWHNLGDVYLGNTIDPEPDGLPGAGADRDDTTTIDDEDGVTIMVPMAVGGIASVKVDIMAPIGVPVAVTGWVDFDHSGTFEEPGERIASGVYTGAGSPVPWTETFQIPATAKGGETYMRFRIYRTEPGVDVLPSPQGPGGEGEVEDYNVYILSDGPGPDDMDFGDAPDPTYPTVMASNGARHLLSSQLYLGSQVDAELNGLPTPLSDGDDSNGLNDEDGVNMPTLLIAGQLTSVTVTASAAGALNAWIDFNIDGDWADPGEHVIAAQPVVAGANAFSFTVPTYATVGRSYVRFRLSSKRDLSYDGDAPDGEVEDYVIGIQKPGTGSITIIKDATPKDDTPFWISVVYGIHGGAAAYRDPSSNTSMIINGPLGMYSIGESVPSGWTLKDIVVTGDLDNGSVIDVSKGSANIDLDANENITVLFKNEKTGGADQDFGDAPDTYGTLLASTGAYHQASSLTLGTVIDTEADGLPNNNAQGDDADVSDDEDGVVNLSDLNLTAGQPGHIAFHINNSDPVALDAGTIIGWIDFNGDGQFQIATEEIGMSHLTIPGATLVKTVLSFPVPLNAVTGTSYARFRLYRDDPNPQAIPILLSPTGDGGEGEVEDYAVTIESGPTPDDRDYGDAPMPYPSANHQVGGPWCGGLGDLPDVESSMQRVALAQGDDQDAQGDDENGLVLAQLIRGSTSSSFLIIPFVTDGSGNVTLAAWIDFNTDGDWDDSGEILGTWALGLLNPSTAYVPFIAVNMPSNTALGDTMLRLRIYEGLMTQVSPSGPAGAGEIEDHLVEIRGSGDPKPPGYTIEGFKFHDLDGNGAWDGMFEPFMPGWPIWLDLNGNGIQDSSDPVTVTDGWGMFQFNGLPAGTYTVGEEMPPGWIQTSPAAPGTFTVSVPTPKGQLQQMILFGNILTEGSGRPGEERSFLKWSQPPLEIDPNLDPESGPPIFCGWGEPARSTQIAGKPRQWRMVMDDFHRLGPIPVTRLRWWGAYHTWDGIEPPELQPEAWHISMWMNTKEELAWDEVYPERMVWSLEVPNERLHIESAGIMQFPKENQDTCFQYMLHLEPHEWFHQADFPAQYEVFWISITAIYPEEVGFQRLWSWQTRQEPWRQGAQIPAITGEWPSPDERLFPGRITPVLNPSLCDEPEPYDLAFELFTEHPWVKWDLPFTGLRHWPHYEDHEAIAIEDEEGRRHFHRRVYDDWVCERPDPVIAVAFNGSYLGYGYEACDCQQKEVTPPRRPDYFLLSIWHDEPANSDIPFEHPGEPAWQFEAEAYDEVMVGYDKHPHGEPNEAVFRYTVRLPEEAWFFQDHPGQDFWFNVQAVYRKMDRDDIIHPWSWTNHLHQHRHTALVVMPTEHGEVYEELLDQVEEPIDMSFTLYTVPPEEP